MSELVEIVDSLENKVSKLLHKMELLHQVNAKLKQELELQKEKNELKESALKEWEEKYDSLKMANTMLGGNTSSKTEAKLKINTLIRELDVCIAKLAD
ncbi:MULTISPECIES: hypothetical protein [Flagellimonas]|uniref:Mis12-Mtw1 protein family n=2 Tax=Flagellimonas TaxID=444459 RepID=G2PS91_ALLRU|nr:MULTISPECIES: hypothetical protein [Allomuricauda]AEM69348.1 hypothetical protein Murru_0292 [Allomuricauda ruestringensis DSM 13258]MEC3965509.1 hypothetical protein [Muricauda sp. SYSU M86414]MEC4265375.1 hypothetical protein [Muricauda sp. SYSU M84420]